MKVSKISDFLRRKDVQIVLLFAVVLIMKSSLAFAADPFEPIESEFTTILGGSLGVVIAAVFGLLAILALVIRKDIGTFGITIVGIFMIGGLVSFVTMLLNMGGTAWTP